MRDAGLEAFALAAIAKELGSVELLDEAFASLGGIAGETSKAVAAGMILDFVAAVAPGRLDEAIARAVALLPSRSTEPKELRGDTLRIDIEFDSGPLAGRLEDAASLPVRR